MTDERLRSFARMCRNQYSHEMKLEKRDSRDVQWFQDPNASVRVDGDKDGQYFESGKYVNNMDASLSMHVDLASSVLFYFACVHCGCNHSHACSLSYCIHIAFLTHPSVALVSS